MATPTIAVICLNDSPRAAVGDPALIDAVLAELRETHLNTYSGGVQDYDAQHHWSVVRVPVHLHLPIHLHIPGPTLHSDE